MVEARLQMCRQQHSIHYDCIVVCKTVFIYFYYTIDRDIYLTSSLLFLLTRLLFFFIHFVCIVPF